MSNKNGRPSVTGPPYGGQRKKSTAKKWILRTAALLVLLLLLVVVLNQGGYIQYPWEEAPESPGLYAGAGLKEGTPGGISQPNPGEADDSTFSFQINARPVFASGESAGDLYIINPASNVYYLRVEIRLEETDEVIYDSGPIPPNHYIDNDKLTKVLKKGEYDAKAYIVPYDPEDPEKQMNSATASLVITVQK